MSAKGPRSAALRIRAALPRDAEILADLRRQAEEVHARLLPDYFRVSPSGRGVDLNGEGTMTVTLVAEGSPGKRRTATAGRGGGATRVLGYVTVKAVDTPRDPAMTPRRRAHVETVVVDEDHRGGGVGTALMHAAASWARTREASELVLTVWSENSAAEAMYGRLGYQPIARILRLPIEP